MNVKVEALLDTPNGHSFEVETWSLGVILYTLVVGRPPFQTEDIKAIYKRIRDNEYEFPTERIISSDVQHLISLILTPVASERPTLHEIVDHTFFTQGPVPSYIPTSAHDNAPDFGRITKSVSDNNLKRLRKYSLLDVDHTVPSSSLPSIGSAGASGGLPASRSITTSIAHSTGTEAGCALIVCWEIVALEGVFSCCCVSLLIPRANLDLVEEGVMGCRRTSGWAVAGKGK